MIFRYQCGDYHHDCKCCVLFSAFMGAVVFETMRNDSFCGPLLPFPGENSCSTCDAVLLQFLRINILRNHIFASLNTSAIDG